jgi:hypothetical protein
MSNHDRQAEAAPATPSSSPTTAASLENRRGDGSRSQAYNSPGLNSAADSTAERQQEISNVDLFKIKALSSAMYHEEREQFFASAHRVAMFVVVAAGTAALSPLRTEWPNTFPALIALFGLIDLVFDVSGKSRLHATLRKSIYTILAEAEVNQPTLSELERRLVLIYADEPPCMHAVSAISYNRAMSSFGRPHKYLMSVGAWHARVRNFWPFSANYFKTYQQLGLS